MMAVVVEVAITAIRMALLSYRRSDPIPLPTKHLHVVAIITK